MSFVISAGNTEELPDFEFLAGGQLVQGPIGEHLTNLNISLEGTIQLEYFERHPPPTPKDNLEHDDWVSSVMSCGDWSVVLRPTLFFIIITCNHLPNFESWHASSTRKEDPK